MFYEKVLKSLSKFVFVEGFAEAVALALASSRNAVFYGPAGHGKSEMAKAVTKELDTFTMSFSKATEVDDLFGGRDMTEYRSGKGLCRYNVEDSFAAKEVAVFEEMFDASPSTLDSLKAALAAKVVENGNQVVPIKTRTILVLTNKSPQEMKDLGSGPLMERFPIQMEVKWESYDKNSYMRMYEARRTGVPTPITATDVEEARASFSEVKISSAMEKVLAGILAESAATNPQSPRVALAARSVVTAHAAVMGAKEVTAANLFALRFLGIDSGDYLEAVRAQERHDKALAAVESLERDLEALQCRLSAATTPIPALQVSKAAKELVVKIRETPVTDGLVQSRNSLQESAMRLAAMSLARAEEATK